MQVRSIPHLFSSLSSLCAFIAMLLLSNMAQAQLIVDTTLSSATISASGAESTSTTSGTLGLEVAPGTSPFSTAQITDLNLTLDDAILLSLGFAELSADPGAIEIRMISPGPAGTVSNGTFDQLGNILAASGQADFSSLFAADMTIDLATLGSLDTEFTDVSISETGGIVTVDATYGFSGLASGILVNIDGRVVASGPAVAVPEPTTAGVLTALTCFALLKRRRS